MFVPTCFDEIETRVRNSRFIARLFPADSGAQARVLVKGQKAAHPGAAHVVFAFVIGERGELLGCSDDGEPPGTAGRPVLEVLKGRSCTNTLLTVTRYFGGTLLGTGGLVKAYADAAKLVLDAACCVPLEQKGEFECVFPYPLYEIVRRYLTEIGAEIIAEDFETCITVRGRVKIACFDDLAVFIRDAGRGDALFRLL